MSKIFEALVCVLILNLLIVASTKFSYSQITSTFDTDADGWTLRNDGDNLTAILSHNSSGGNTGAFISGVVPADLYPAYFWQAPSKFLGNLVYRSYKQTLTFSQQQAVVGDNAEYNGNYYESDYADIIISNGSTSIYYHSSPKPSITPAWSTYSVTLDATTPWRTGSQIAYSSLATNEQIKAVLINVTSLYIRGNYNNTANTVGLDNVSLGQRAVNTKPAISGISDSSGKPGSNITINGSGFGTTISNNAVFFGGMAATISSASATQINVTVPIGASLDKISVTNKTTGLTTSSSQLFIPTFDNGGRLIPASFGSRQDIFLASGNRVSGVAIADLDGDGWNELIAGEHGPNSVAIFPNLGNGGDLSISSFGSKISLPGGSNGNGPIVKDFDGDGKLDLLCGSNDSFNYFATFRNISTPGNIAFEAVEYWPGLVYSGFITTSEDVDGDGLIDLIGQHGNGSAAPDFWISQNISTIGNIEFSVAISFFGSATLDAGAGVYSGDLNNDGKVDFVVKHGFGGAFSIVENTSTPGTISLATPILFSESAQGDMRIADLNQDGKNEIIFAELYSGDDVQIKINSHTTGPITAADFQTEIVLKSDLFYSSGGLSVSDLNGDGKLDIILTDASNLGYFENVFDGGVLTSNSFVEAYISDGGGSYIYPLGPVSGDLNGDGRPDIAFGITNAAARVALYQNKNVHTPVISLNTVSPLKGEAGSTVTITGDYFSTTPSENKVMFGDVQASVTSATKTMLTVTVPLGVSMAAVSVTRDQLTSTYPLPFVPTFSSGVTFDNSHFAPPVNFLLTTVLYDIVAGDLNNDGKVDIVADGISGNSYAFRNTHVSGGISTSSLLPNDTLNGAANPRLYDLDGDGKKDLISNGGAYRNISNGSQLNFDTYAYLTPGGFIFKDFADFNRDGKVDLIGVTSSIVSISENRTTRGAFTNTAPIASLSDGYYYTKSSTGGAVVAVDFDKDGLIDFATTNPGSDNISVWKNAGAYRISTSQFTALPDIAVGDNPARIYHADLDIDGKVDIIIFYASGTSSTVATILHNESTVGNITFTRFDITVPTLVTVAHISDLDGDGKPDIIATSETGNQFFILKNIFTSGAFNTSSFAAPFSITINKPRGLTTADLNLDGKPEIIITAAPNSLLVYENLIPASPTCSPPVISFVTPSTTSCLGEPIELFVSVTGSIPFTYQWKKNSIDIPSETSASIELINPINSDAGTYSCTVTNACGSITSANITLTLTTKPNPPSATSAGSCIASSVTLNASGSTNGNYRWYQDGFDPDGFPIVELIPGEVNSSYTTPTLNSTTTYYASIANGSCESNLVSVTATIGGTACSNQPPTINTFSTSTAIGSVVTIDLKTLTSDSDNNLDINSFQIITSPISGAVATIASGILTLDYSGNTFTGTDQITIKVCDLIGACAQQILEIEVTEELELEVFNAVSPNNDGKNDTFILANIDKLLETKSNTVTIYNRWGSKVFEVEDYNNTTNVFRGLNNNGNELPSGTYFYKIEFHSPQSTPRKTSGYLVLKQ